jgi:hypothetical protein
VLGPVGGSARGTVELFQPPKREPLRQSRRSKAGVRKSGERRIPKSHGDIRVSALFPAPLVVIPRPMNRTPPFRTESKSRGKSVQSTRFADMRTRRLPGARLAFALHGTPLGRGSSRPTVAEIGRERHTRRGKCVHIRNRRNRDPGARLTPMVVAAGRPGISSEQICRALREIVDWHLPWLQVLQP